MEIRVFSESWPIRGSFTISRGSKTAAEVVVVELTQNGITGRGECVPYARYGESVQGVIEKIESMIPAIREGLDRRGLQLVLNSGAARNALDCAFWDLESKQKGLRIWEYLDVAAPQPLLTAYTLSLDTPENMQQAAEANAFRPLLKLKLAGAGDLDRVAAVRKGSPSARIIVDANEGWNEQIYRELIPELQKLGVEMIEQPLPAGDDAILASLPRPIPICADESCHDSSTLHELVGRYDMINIKLDKTGGLTEALVLREQAEAAGMKIMVGCMLASSLAMAPAFVVAQGAQVVDLDGPLLLQKDREPGFDYSDNLMHAPVVALWG
jgi:L-Ala-D/L-Glu epimerase